jgi:hypothetical protein
VSLDLAVALLISSSEIGVLMLVPVALAGHASLKRLWRRAVEAESLIRVADEIRALAVGFDQIVSRSGLP